MSLLWEPTKEEVDRTLTELEPDPILAHSREHETAWQRENQQIDACVFILTWSARFFFVSVIIWLGWKLGEWIGNL